MQIYLTYYTEIKCDFWVISQITDYFNKTPSLIFYPHISVSLHWILSQPH